MSVSMTRIDMDDTVSLTGKRWMLRRNSAVDVVGTLKRERGITDDPGAKLTDPFLFPEMNTAVRRIREAMEKKETIGIFGDYDADGVTGTAQLIRFFRRHGTEPVVNLPDRQRDGYGMKIPSIQKLHERGVTLLLTVDTGIASHAEIMHAASLGIDVIVTDHHRPSAGRPPAHAVIHPLVPSPFPNEHLSGSGVAFMLLRALEDGKPWEGIEFDIALATIGTVGDLVPLTGENRTLVLHGLRFLSDLPPSPLRDFIDEVRSSGPLTAGDVAFRVVPRINAAGRMAHADIALRALLEGGEALAELHLLNGERRAFVDELDALLKDAEGSKDLFVVVASSEVTPGTAGLIASRFTERLGRPALVAALQGDTYTASVRSPEGVDVMDALTDESVKSLLLTVGGHAQAAGCTFRTSNLPALRVALTESLRSRGHDEANLRPTLALDAAITPVALGMGFVQDLQSLQPFGAGNEEPVFLLRSQPITNLRAVGSDGAHLQCTVAGVKGIAFGLGALAEEVGTGLYDIACRLQKNTWNGRESVQLQIEDVRKAEEASA